MAADSGETKAPPGLARFAYSSAVGSRRHASDNPDRLVRPLSSVPSASTCSAHAQRLHPGEAAGPLLLKERASVLPAYSGR